VHSVWKGRPRNDLYCVGWEAKPYSLTHSLTVLCCAIHYAAFLLGCITGLTSPFVSVSVCAIRDRNSGTERHRKARISVTVPRAGITGVPIFSSTGQLILYYAVSACHLKMRGN